MGDIGLWDGPRERPRHLPPTRELPRAPRSPETAGRPAARPPPGREAMRIAAAWMLVVPAVAWLAVRASGVGAGTWIETAIVLTPFVALGSVVVLASWRPCGCGPRSWRPRPRASATAR